MTTITFDFSRTRINQAGEWIGLLLTIKNGETTRRRRVDVTARGVTHHQMPCEGPIISLPRGFEIGEAIMDRAGRFMGIDTRKLRPELPTRFDRSFTVPFRRPRQSFFG